MPTALPKNDPELHKAFGIILSIESFSKYVIGIAELVYDNELDRENIQRLLDQYNIRKIEDIKEELIDLLIVYINLILNDHIISDNEKLNIDLLKKYFRIKEGDFYTYRHQEVGDILHRQFERVYFDNSISKEEAMHIVDLQGLFNLSYDQFDKFKQDEISRALEQGAAITDLDTAKFPKSNSASYGLKRRYFSKQIEDLVWNRDNGKCRECKSFEQLGFDHIIPLSKGGPNTFRNIQLLCETCGRKKRDRIG
ncbi:HNH endonuclease [Belliella marina]|uniref:HNH endonuclease n=1 Tax=Belliella marina TaxID=1644146 RepID=A0ABW4VMA5_9BACT